ncbi:hypothetical protein C8J56DRAFT_888916 [Mycena floridula]|nr:hypothetical protein C8J56DRAFT_888916 [Mycena floridula]
MWFLDDLGQDCLRSSNETELGDIEAAELVNQFYRLLKKVGMWIIDQRQASSSGGDVEWNRVGVATLLSQGQDCSLKKEDENKKKEMHCPKVGVMCSLSQGQDCEAKEGKRQMEKEVWRWRGKEIARTERRRTLLLTATVTMPERPRGGGTIGVKSAIGTRETDKRIGTALADLSACDPNLATDLSFWKTCLSHTTCQLRPYTKTESPQAKTSHAVIRLENAGLTLFHIVVFRGPATIDAIKIICETISVISPGYRENYHPIG